MNGWTVRSYGMSGWTVRSYGMSGWTVRSYVMSGWYSKELETAYHYRALEIACDSVNFGIRRKKTRIGQLH